MDGSFFKKTILVDVHQLEDYFLQPICQQFSDELETTVEERNLPKLICCQRCASSVNKSDV